MDPRLVQRTRYLLQARVRRAKSCPEPLFASAVLHLLDWVHNHPLLGAVAAALRPIAETFDAAITAAEAIAQRQSNRLAQARARSLEDHAALCYRVLDVVAASTREDVGRLDESDAEEDGEDERLTGRRVQALAALLYGQFTNNASESVERLRDIAVDGFYEYLDESIDSRNAIMGLLIKYKQRAEWFHRVRLRQLGAMGLERRRKGEESLAVDLQEYVFDQGVEFSIEQTSASGEADLVLRDVDGSHVVLDAKYLPLDAAPSEIRRKISHGFHQVARYCNDFHEPAGYLVVFNADTKRPRLPVEVSDGFEFVTVKGKQIYYVPVDIADAPTASRAGQAEEVPLTLEDICTLHLDDSA